MLEDGGYEQLVKESLRISKEKNLINACPPDFPDKEAWRAGVAEQEESWLKSILGMHKEKNSSETLVSAGRFVTNPEKPDLVIIRHLREINKSIRVESPEPGPVSKPKTIAKKILTRMLPIGSYVGQLNLSPDKVTNVTVL